MPRALRLLGITMLAGIVVATTRPPAVAHASVAPSGCASDSNFQRIAFWAGDWDVYDSVGTRYASQHVRAVVDACAFTAEWIGPVGDKGLSITAYDPRTHDWKQTYVSNQVPTASGVSMRKSDSSYHGAGVRFIPLIDPAANEMSRLRITIVPLADHRVRQTFEESSDAGRTWRTVFNAEHRPH